MKNRSRCQISHPIAEDKLKGSDLIESSRTGKDGCALDVQQIAVACFILEENSADCWPLEHGIQ
jgi:hypothetical protein